MYSVFNKILQSDMGKTIVRKHAQTLDTQSVWKELNSHMSTSSKGLNERCRLHAYMSTTVYDKSWKGTTEQFVLHFHDQLRQLDEVTPLSEHYRLLSDQYLNKGLWKTMEEYMSLTQSSTGEYSLTYDKYFMMLQNACIRYDKTLKHKPSPTSRAVYQHELDDDDPCIPEDEEEYLDDDFAPDGIDTPSDDMYNVHNTNFKMTPHVKSLIPRTLNGKFKPYKGIPPKPRYNGPVYLPKHNYNMLSEDIKKELDKYNQDKKAQYKPNHSRMAKVHEQEHEEVDDDPDHPEPDLANHFHEES